jgi:hypothetical protein
MAWRSKLWKLTRATEWNLLCGVNEVIPEDVAGDEENGGDFGDESGG